MRKMLRRLLASSTRLGPHFIPIQELVSQLRGYKAHEECKIEYHLSNVQSQAAVASARVEIRECRVKNKQEEEHTSVVPTSRPRCSQQ